MARPQSDDAHFRPIRRVLIVITAVLLIALFLVASAPLVRAQGADVAIGIASFDPDAPVEVTADELSIDQTTGVAVFEGNVLVVQADIRMTAELVTVLYSRDESGGATGVSEVQATGGVTIVTPTDAAESTEAIYAVNTGFVTMTGDVLLTQAQTALSGEKLTLDLNAGTGRMEGRVRTVFVGGQN